MLRTLKGSFTIWACWWIILSGIWKYNRYFAIYISIRVSLKKNFVESLKERLKRNNNNCNRWYLIIFSRSGLLCSSHIQICLLLVNGFLPVVFFFAGLFLLVIVISGCCLCLCLCIIIGVGILRWFVFENGFLFLILKILYSKDQFSLLFLQISKKSILQPS